ncbi:MAG: glycosyltransferase family 39 protein, partial [Nitrospirota bacterium]
MNKCTSSPNSNYDVWAYVILIVTSILIAVIPITNIKISPDAMRFGLISQQILSGNGIRVPIIRLEDTYVPVNGAIPFLDQMPLIPLLFALLGGLTPQSYMPAQLVNVVCHTAISCLTFLIMKKLSNKWLALLTGLLVAFSYPLLWLANHICSDSLLIALMTAAVYFLILSRSAVDSQSNWRL